MISLSNIGNAGSAMHYFSQDNYYTQEQGLAESAWFGLGAQALGLRGKVGTTEFAQVLRGEVAGQALGKWVKNEKTGVMELDHRPGTDITFSAPKSVSLLAEVAGHKDVRDAHEAAVLKALTYIERELAGTRHTLGGTTETVRTGNLIVALFRHNTSRDLDPQTHTHAVILNATRRVDGQWRSIDNKALFENQRVIGAIYMSELAKGLQKRGYELERTDDKGNFEISGFNREQTEAFSQRRAAMQEALDARGIDIEHATQQQKEDAALMTRGRKTEVNHDQLISDWNTRAEKAGIDFTDIEMRAQERRDSGKLAPQDAMTGRDALVFAAAHRYEREAVVSKSEILSTAIAHGVGRVGSVAVMNAFAKLERDGDLIRLPDGNYTSRKMLGSESWALENVRAHKNSMPALMTVQEVAARIAAEETSRNAQTLRTQGRDAAPQFAFTEGQAEALTLAFTTQDRYMEVQGLAGTGKTTMLRALNTMAQERGYVVRGMAPTGAASQTLSREAGISSDTVSMFHVKEKKLQADIAFAQQYAADFQRRREMWVVDESSFLSQKQKAVIDAMAIKADAKVIYLGDKLQLQGVDAGKPFELAQADGIATAFMTEISRQKTPNMKKAVAIMTGQDQLQPGQRLTAIELANNGAAFRFMDEAGMVREIDDRGGQSASNPLVEAVVDDVLELERTRRMNTLVITPFNKDRMAINVGLREGLRARGELRGQDQMREVLVRPDLGGKTRATIKEAQYYKRGDVVRSGKNYKAVNLSQGEYTRVVEVRAQMGTVVLQKDDGQQILWEPKKYNKVEVYKSEVRAIAIGDMIRITRNGGRLTNGTVAVVENIQGNAVTLSIDRGGRVESHQIDLRQDKHWDHAYASTVHAAQGVTQDNVIFLIRTPEGDTERRQDIALQQMAKVFADRGFYVGVTRASHETRIYTNDKSAAAKAVGIRQDKTSAVETIKRFEWADEPVRAASKQLTGHVR